MEKLVHESHSIEELNIESLQKKLQQYKIHNAHINETNDKMMQEKQMLKKYLQELNTNYAELVQVAEEAVKRRKVAQKRNKVLTKKNEEILERFCFMQKESLHLKRKSQALDGLDVLVEAAHYV